MCWGNDTKGIVDVDTVGRSNNMYCSKSLVIVRVITLQFNKMVPLIVPIFCHLCLTDPFFGAFYQLSRVAVAKSSGMLYWDFLKQC